jgi:porphobilinogen synthase
MRRLHRAEALRRMARETRLSPDHLIQPLFVVPGQGARKQPWPSCEPAPH